jgi:hypothetical protein
MVLEPAGFEYGLPICDCPFCGSAYVKVTGYERRAIQGREQVAFVCCEHCKAIGPTVTKKNLRQAARNAIRKWNCSRMAREIWERKQNV